MIPYDMPVTQPGSAVHQNTSSGCRSSAEVPVAWCATTASWTWTAPLGVPVVPLVKCSSAMSSGSVGGISNLSEAAASRPLVAERRRRCPRTAAVVAADEEHVLELRQRCADGGDLAPVQRRRRDQHAPVAAIEPLPDRLGPEGREQRAQTRCRS